MLEGLSGFRKIYFDANTSSGVSILYPFPNSGSIKAGSFLPVALRNFLLMIEMRMKDYQSLHLMMEL